MNFETFTTEIAKFDFFEDMMVNSNEKEIFGHFTVNGHERALYQLRIREASSDDEFPGLEPPPARGEPVMVMIHPDMVSHTIWNVDNGYKGMIDELLLLKSRFDEFFPKGTWKPGRLETGIRYFCTNASFIYWFNVLLVELDGMFNVFEKIPAIRYYTFYFALKSDKKWKERLSIFMDARIEKKEHPDIVLLEEERETRVFTKTRKEHVLHELEWDVPYVVGSDDNLTRYTIVKMDDTSGLKVDTIVTLIFYLLHEAGKVPIPSEEELSSVVNYLHSMIVSNTDR